MSIKNEQDVLNIETRQDILRDIKEPQNMQRKAEAQKRYYCYKDQTKRYVAEQLLRQLDSETVDEMKYCLSNISIVRKVIDKLARVYSSGVVRSGDKDEETNAIKEIEDAINLNTELKKTNKYLKLQKNLALYLKIIETDNGYTIKPEPLQPHQYDAFSTDQNPTQPILFILSEFVGMPIQATTSDAASAGRFDSVPIRTAPVDPNKENSNYSEPKEFVWWTKSYHFTTNENGEIIKSPYTLDSVESSVSHGLGVNPIINFALDQDAQLWAIGGDDLVDGAILINSVITHNQHVAISQGYGQFYMTGKGLPRKIKVGPTKSILLEYDEGDPKPELGFASANPQIAELRGLVEMYVALLLTTNNLSTSAVSSNLQGGQAIASGVAIMLDQAESREDVQDQQQIFVDKEREVWNAIKAIKDVYGDKVIEPLKGQFDNVYLKFNEASVIVSESERLANLKARKELGIDSMVDLIMKDDATLTKDEAEKKLLVILAEKIKGGLDANNQDQSQPIGTVVDAKPSDGVSGNTQDSAQGTAS